VRTANQDRATSVCEPYRELIEQGLARCRNVIAIAIWQDLVSDHGYPHGYQTLSALFGGCADRSRHKPWGIILTPPPPRSYPQMRAAELEDQVAGGTMSTAPKTSRKATT